MTKTQLIDELTQATGQSKGDSEKNLDALLTVLSAALAKGERVDLRGFGTFRVRETRARQGRNIRTGEAITIAAKRVAAFRPGKDLSQKVNNVGASGTAAPEESKEA